MTGVNPLVHPQLMSLGITNKGLMICVSPLVHPQVTSLSKLVKALLHTSPTKS